MTIRPEHPFLPPEGARDPVRRLRGRLPAPVTVWTAGEGRDRAGWTVSSVLLADGEPAEVLGLVDEDSDLAEVVLRTRTLVVNVLTWPQRALADAFAGLAPAPGGPFRLADWSASEWGPVLTGSTGWVGARLRPAEPEHAGWGLLVRATVERVHVDGAPEAEVLGSFRGRYHPVSAR